MKWGEPFDDELKGIENVDFSIAGIKNVRKVKLPFGHRWMKGIELLPDVILSLILVHDLSSFGTIDWMVQKFGMDAWLTLFLVFFMVFIFTSVTIYMLFYWMTFLVSYGKYDIKGVIFSTIALGGSLLTIIMLYFAGIINWMAQTFHWSFIVATIFLLVAAENTAWSEAQA